LRSTITRRSTPDTIVGPISATCSRFAPINNNTHSYFNLTTHKQTNKQTNKQNKQSINQSTQQNKPTGRHRCSRSTAIAIDHADLRRERLRSRRRHAPIDRRVPAATYSRLSRALQNVNIEKRNVGFMPIDIVCVFYWFRLSMQRFNSCLRTTFNQQTKKHNNNNQLTSTTVTLSSPRTCGGVCNRLSSVSLPGVKRMSNAR
jgi:hypothetical protein